MRLDPPSWWYDERAIANRLISIALSPAAAAYHAATARRFRRVEAFRAPFPVICVGNLTAGGTGKTPMSRKLAEIAREHGRNPAVLTRGYKGRMAGPLWVNTEADTAHDVGDEPLLLARDVPTMVSRDRAAGAREIAASRTDIDCLIMDDGLQNPALVKDLAIAVVDARRGIGNGHVIPAGPLRARLDFQRKLVDLVVYNWGFGKGTERSSAAKSHDLFEPAVEAISMQIAPRPADWHHATKSAIAYAGIGNPENFFDTLRAMGIKLAETYAFPDHHIWQDTDAVNLLRRADETGLPVITTEKDHVRLAPDSSVQMRLASQSRVLEIEADFNPGDRSLLDRALARLFA